MIVWRIATQTFERAIFLQVFIAATFLNGCAGATSTKGVSPNLPGMKLILSDEEKKLSVSYEPGNPTATFVFTMPRASSISIQVDRNTDGKWGYGPYVEGNRSQPQDDYAFSQTTENFPCPQYIYSSIPGRPDLVYSTSFCGRRPSGAVIEFSAPDENNLVKSIFRIPCVELFGTRHDAHVAFLLWDGKMFKSYNSPSDPMVLQLGTSACIGAAG